MAITAAWAAHMQTRNRPTERVGLYDPGFEHDACGVAFVARLDGQRTHETVDRAIMALENLEHRGAEGADPNTGDGAGILLQIPDAFFRDRVEAEHDLPPAGQYGVGVVMLPGDKSRHAELEAHINRAVEAEGQRVVKWRDVPTDKDFCGLTALYHRPYVKHVIVAASDDLAARPGRLRAQALRHPPRGRARRRAGARGLHHELADHRLQGDAHPAAAQGLLPRAAGPEGRDARSRSSTAASPPTPSRAGSWRTRTG